MFSVYKLCFHIYRVLVSASYNTIIIVCLLQPLDWKVYHWLCLVVGQTSQGLLYRGSWRGSPSSQRAKTNGKFLFQNGFFCRSWTSTFSHWPLQLINTNATKTVARQSFLSSSKRNWLTHRKSESIEDRGQRLFPALSFCLFCFCFYFWLLHRGSERTKISFMSYVQYVCHVWQ